jgi:23S rRNA (cytosine1962-C5)-methyltransferase
VVQVRDARGASLGSAFWNPNSKIRARLFSRATCEADLVFFEQTLARALAWRQRHFDPEAQSVRLVFGEADGIPGLIVDSFVGRAAGAPASGRQGRWLSVQFLSLGVELRKSIIIEALQRILPCDGIMERSDAPVRAFEGLAPATGPLAGQIPEAVIMRENGLEFEVDILGGQKTGWFLDQRSNRKAAASFARGRPVLDCFCNQGGFALACAREGAASVLAVDSSAEALAALQKNARRNKLEPTIQTRQANAFDLLRELEAEHRGFGLIILDPPAFAKNRAAVEAARRGYREINIRALRLLQPEGILVTNTCSHWFGSELFGFTLEEAARDAGKRFRLVEERSQDLDHPVVSGYPESRYLTCRILDVM